MKTIILLLALATTVAAETTNLPTPLLVITNWINPATQVQESVIYWPPTNQVPSTLWELQHGFTNSDEGEPVTIGWQYPDMLITRQLCVPLPCHDLRFIMLLPYSPQYVFRFVPRTKPPELFPGGPITEGPEAIMMMAGGAGGGGIPGGEQTLQSFERDGSVRSLKVQNLETHLRKMGPKKREAFRKKLEAILK